MLIFPNIKYVSEVLLGNKIQPLYPMSDIDFEIKKRKEKINKIINKIKKEI